MEFAIASILFAAHVVAWLFLPASKVEELRSPVTLAPAAAA
jgi:hypothetical protein